MRRSGKRTVRRKKNNLILDIDETLISAIDFHEVNSAVERSLKNHKVIKMNDYLIALRPGVEEFLDFAFANFNVGVWSAGTRPYVKEVVRKLITSRGHKLDFELNRVHCSFSEHIYNEEQKDLSFVFNVMASKTHNKKNTIIIDNLRTNTIDIQPENSIWIPDFDARLIKSKKDRYMFTLTECLKKYTNRSIRGIKCNFQ